MKGLRFLDFDLTFQRAANGYRVQADSPAGQASVDFALPFSDLEIENFLLRFGRARQPMRRLRNPQIEAARAFGGRLFAAAFTGEVRGCLRSSIDDAGRQDAGLRIRLRLTDVPELNDLPWEFLRHPELDRFLALSSETPLVRYLELPERIRPLAVKPPLEVLTVISSPTDYAQLDVEAEWRKLQESLAELQERDLLILNRLESPTLTHLQRWLRRQTCHILHFIGHGGFNPKTEDGLLLFADEKGRGREVTGQTLGTLLHDHRPLRLAVLNACEGARTSRTDPFAGVAQSLVQQGIPAVVAMQFEISDKAAITFAYELYTAIVDGYPVDAALAEARKALFFAGHELEWGTPVLYMRSPDGRIFDIEAAAPQARPAQKTVAAAPAPAPLPAEKAGPPPVSHIITSPIVGTFYRDPSPGAPPFVEVGSRVKKGQVLCIIEAMKLMNEIESNVDGEILEIYPQNAQPVEFDEPLFAVRPAAPQARPAQTTVATAPAPLPAEKAGPPPVSHIIASPLVGTFYRSPSPNADPFVEVGSRVKKGQVLCLIEAMKLLNEIESNVDGEILEIYPQNAQPLEFDEPLFAVRPSGS